MSDLVLEEREGSVAVLTLNRPEKRNALDGDMWRALTDAMQAIDADDSVRCVVITGAGDHFSGGADIGAFAEEVPCERRSLHALLRVESPEIRNGLLAHLAALTN